MDVVWQAISYVTTGLTLAAFVAALIAWVIRQRMTRERDLIEKAPDEDRADLVLAALEFFQVDTADMSKQQKFDIAMTQISNRAQRFTKICLVVVIFGIILLIGTISIVRSNGLGEEKADQIQAELDGINESLGNGEAPPIEAQISGTWGEPGCVRTYTFLFEEQTLTVDELNPRVEPAEQWIYRKVESSVLTSSDGTQRSRLQAEEREGIDGISPGTLAVFTFTDAGRVQTLVWETRSPMGGEIELVRCDGD